MRNPSARPDILTGRPWLLAIGRLLEVGILPWNNPCRNVSLHSSRSLRARRQ
jgi:hypothetical protein